MRHENDREETAATTKLTYLLVGGAIGAIVALLFAPKSGQELREDIAEATRKGIEKGKEAAAVVGEKAGEYYEVTKERAGEILHDAQEAVGEFGDKAKDAVTSATNPFSAAIEAGKEAYNEEKRKNEVKSIKDGRPNYPVESES
jgi:gas vesicle protein